MTASRLSRDDLIGIVKRIQMAQDRGQDYSALLATLQAHVAYPEVASLVHADYPPEYVVDYSLGWRQHVPKLSRDEMIELVRKIVAADGTEAEGSLRVRIFDENCKHPAKDDLIFYPDQYFGGSRQPSVEEIVDKAMAPE